MTRLRAVMTVKKRPKKTKKSTTAPCQAASKPRARGGAVTTGELSVLSFESGAEFNDWLAAAHASSPGIWLRLMKKASGVPSVSYQQALDVAIAWGWIDGQLKPHDAKSWLRKFVPRGARSIWSKINREKALRLIAAQQMQPAGLAQVERAKRDGRWQAAYSSQSTATVPPDLAAALGRSPRAAAFFRALEARNRYAVLFRVQAAKKAETRERKIREFVAMLERGEKIHP
ncbi:MAG TPA: YdeI/OmpD-associated family protein [Polyangiaceae bacterium]|nr:YdeI/OmpD-associated family protein [Polyangiaceae bacterium]